jgi:hypothetical protein
MTVVIGDQWTMSFVQWQEKQANPKRKLHQSLPRDSIGIYRYERFDRLHTSVVIMIKHDITTENWNNETINSVKQ